MGDRRSGTTATPASRVASAPPSRAPLPPLGVRPWSVPPAAAHELELRQDIRRRRPTALSFLLRMSTLRRVSRVITLLALDFIGVAAAIFTALVLKEAFHEPVDASRALHGSERLLPFAYLLTALLFARSGLYAERGLRPGLSRIVGSLFEVAFVALIFAVVNGEHFSSYYLFYGSLAFAILYVSLLRAAYERAATVLLRAAGYRRRTLLVGRGAHIGDVAHALAHQPSAPVEVVGFLAPNAIPDTGLRALGSLRDLERVLDEDPIDEVIIADPEFPQDDAVELVDQCHRRGVRVRLAPSTMEILIHRAEFVPGQSVPLFELSPPVFEGVDFALKRTFDVIAAALLLLLLSPLLALIALSVRLSSRGPILFHSVRRGIGQRPFACLKFRTMHSDAEERQADLEDLNEATGALFKIRADPRLTRVGRVLRRFSLDELPQLVNVIRGDMSSSAPARSPSATTRCSRTGTVSATSSSRGSRACGRSPVAPSSTSTTSSISTSSISSAGPWRWT